MHDPRHTPPDPAAPTESHAPSADRGNPVTEDVRIATPDGRALAGTLFLPEEGRGAGNGTHADGDRKPDAAPGTPRAAVVIHPATAVDRHLYRAFAAHLAAQGRPTLIYDYRGTGDSALPTDARDAGVRMSDWMLADVPAATRFLRQRFPDRPILAVGHSVGAHGQAASFREEPVAGLAMVASHAGITRLVPALPERAKLWWVFNVFTPATARLLGRVPVERVGMGKPVPLGVMAQWRRWTNRPGYFFEDPGLDLAARYGEVTAPVLSVVFRDDPWATREASDVLLERMRVARVRRLDVDPAAEGLGTVGHMGFFRTRSAALWPRVTDWLDEVEAREA